MYDIGDLVILLSSIFWTVYIWSGQEGQGWGGVCGGYIAKKIKWMTQMTLSGHDLHMYP